jgi:Fic-DOC domain mobile mystery protein B
MEFEYSPGATPLNQDEIDGLIPSHMTMQGQLDEWEAANILKAEGWVFSSAWRGNFLTLDFVRLLHKKMFDETWRWAGTFRSSNKNIGNTDYPLITTALTNLLDDVTFQVVNQSFSMDEIAYRFHHRLVSIHPFSNGNGRHARLMTDLLLMQAGESRFSWGREQLGLAGPVRKQYISALKAADRHDYDELSRFVRS